MHTRRNRPGPEPGLASHLLTHPRTNAQLRAGAGTDPGQHGATGGLVNQASAFEASKSSLGEPQQLDLLMAGAHPPWSGVSRGDWGLIYRGL